CTSDLVLEPVIGILAPDFDLRPSENLPKRPERHVKEPACKVSRCLHLFIRSFPSRFNVHCPAVLDGCYVTAHGGSVGFTGHARVPQIVPPNTCCFGHFL